MRPKRISRSELQLLERLWELGPSSVRAVQEALPERDRLAYTTVQTMIYRLERKGAVRRIKKIGNAHIFEATLTRTSVHRRLVTDLLEIFGSSPASVMSHFVETGKLTLSDLRAIEKEVSKRDRKT